jgi:hypothetical protein
MITLTGLEELLSQTQSRHEYKLMFKLIIKEKLIELVICLKIAEFLLLKLLMDKFIFLIISSILKLQLTMKLSQIFDCSATLKKDMV